LRRTGDRLPGFGGGALAGLMEEGETGKAGVIVDGFLARPCSPQEGKSIGDELEIQLVRLLIVW